MKLIERVTGILQERRSCQVVNISDLFLFIEIGICTDFYQIFVNQINTKRCSASSKGNSSLLLKV